MRAGPRPEEARHGRRPERRNPRAARPRGTGRAGPLALSDHLERCAMLVNTRRVTIEWGDCDPAGIVHYPRYFAMFDAATAALFQAALGMTKKAMLKRYDVVGFPMVDTRATFRVPCAFGDEVRIESTVAEFRRASFDVRHRLLRDDGAVLAVEGFETRVWVGRHPDKPDGIKALPIPEDLIARFNDPPGAP